MNDPLNEIMRRKPQLSQFYQNALHVASHYGPVNHEITAALKNLAYASEFLYINIEALIPVLLQRNELAVFSSLLYSLAKTNHRFAAAFLTHYGKLALPLSTIADGISFLTSQCANKVKNGEKVLVSCLGADGPGKCLFLLRQWGCIASFSPGIVAESFRLYENRLKQLNWALLSQWFSRAEDLFTSNRSEEATQFLLLRSKESRRLLGMNNVVLDDYKKVLKIYCASLSGRDMLILGLNLSQFNMKTPYTDGTSIFLPDEIGFFTNPELNERTYTALAAIQAASIQMGTFTLDLEKISFRTELQDRYGLLLPAIKDNVNRQYKGIAQSVREREDGELEVVFPNDKKILVLNTEHEKLFYSFPSPDFAKELFTLVENTRIEIRLAGRYPGLKEDFELTNTHLFKARPGVRVNEKDDRLKKFMAVLECLIQYSLKNKIKAEINDPELLKIIQDVINTYRIIYKPGKKVEDSASVLFQLYNLFYDNFPITGYFTRNDARDLFPQSVKPSYFPEIVQDITPDLLKENEANQFVPEEGEGEMTIDLTSMRESDARPDDLRQAVLNGTYKLYRYPEYNYTKKGYEENHCILFESVLPSMGDAEFYQKTMATHKLIYKRIKKRFLLMKPDEMEYVRRWYSGDDIHLTDALDYSIGLARGETVDDKIYVRKIKNNRDIAVALLIDSSSSTDTPVYGTKIIDIEKQALCLLAGALSIVEDPFGIFSFYSMGRQRVFMNILKDFHEPWTGETQKRIESLNPYASNRDGCAIRHITERLKQRTERTRLLILLSDGIPADLGYGGSGSSDTTVYAIEDTRRAIIECRKENIIPYCITIDKYAKKYISHLYGDYHHTILSDVTRLPEHLSRLYYRLTR
ncbi:MAG: hypothetical protein JW969_18565 [Spirochaetales bacterium]|nr:hypothetical protein [Spirochaetales bacterium]